MQSKTGFPSSCQLQSYVTRKSRLKFAARYPVSGCWPSCYAIPLTRGAVVRANFVKNEHYHAL